MEHEAHSSPPRKRSRPPAVDLKFFCCLVGNEAPFAVVISSSGTVYDLKERVQAKRPNGLKGIDAANLDLFQVYLQCGPDLAEQVKSEVEGKEPLNPTTDIIEIFPENPPKGYVHIAVKKRGGASIPSRRGSPSTPSPPDCKHTPGWSRNFVGEHHRVLLKNIRKMHARKVRLINEGAKNKDLTDYGYLNHVALIQSSGSGKSRMVDELAKLIPTIPINIRPQEETEQYAHPPPDTSLRDLFIQSNFPTDDFILQERFYHILINLFHLVTEEIKHLMEGKDWSKLSELAQAWHQHLEEDKQSYRQDLYNRTKLRVEKRASTLVAQMSDEFLRLLANQADKSLESLCTIIGKLKQDEPPLGLVKDELHLVLYIDEVDGLADKTVVDFSGVSRTALQSLLSALSRLKHPIFVIYLSTQPDTAKLAPSAQLFKSARAVKLAPYLNAPITETPFDCVGKPIRVRRLTLSLLSNPVFLSLFGRPLWHSMMLPDSQTLLEYLQGESQEQEYRLPFEAFISMMRLARCKLLGSTLINVSYRSEIPGEISPYPTRTAKMAIIGVRLMPVVEASHTLGRQLVASHMQTVFSVPQSREWIRSGYPSEPILAEAAAWQVQYWRSKQQDGDIDCMLDMLHTHLSSDLLSPGEIGEVTGRMILLTARDHAGYDKESASLPDTRSLSGHILLTAFILELFPEDVATTFLCSRAPNDREGRSLREVFEHDVINFTHWERFTDDSAATPKALLSAFIRGAAIICRNNSPYIDTIIPVLRRKNVDDDTLNETNMTAVLVQFKLRTKPASPASIRTTAESVELVQPNEEKSRPYILMILELGIGTTPHTLFSKTPTQRKSKAGEELKKLQTANQSHHASSPQRSQTPLRYVIPSPPRLTVVTRSCAAPKLIHPGYLIYVRGCSDSVYKVVREQERDTYKSLLRKTALLAEHPRQDPQTIQEVRQQRPFVSEDKASHHWNDIYDDLSEDGDPDLDTADYRVGAAAEDLLHSEEEGGENRMDEEVGGEGRMDEDGRENRIDQGEGMDQGEQGMDEMEP
ncbi:hypothetical protein K435DRAFT_773348 [Dendrothele bispora CBS 962.96]|uniref:Crinkler effector protein N-terminal domain-containing protein n=1 Tax=Dendrothele bispora (strain CBS 962.96) TaxID=1314807 RepID=A0A4S8MTB0_DENBC|nr:hypothetical protein K435DRAFT_773348 [Dendrothele bispora CBS 962.96]